MTTDDTDTARARLAEAQTGLLRALLAGGEPPAGFDRGRLAVETDILLNRRRQQVAGCVGELRDALGDELFRALFDAYAAETPRTTDTGTHADAEHFSAWVGEHPGSGEPPRPRPRWWRRRQISP